MVLLAVGFVAAMVLAWFHAEKGEQKAGGLELLMLGALLIVAATGVMIVSRGRAADADSRRGIAVGDSVAADSAAAPARSAAEARSIAVLPFADMSQAKDQEYFSDGIMEDLLTNLSKIGSLRVISRTSAMTYKGTSKLVPEIARELGVAHVVEGSVRRQGERIRITAQLIRASDDAHLWAESYDRDIADLFAVQTEIATAIAQALDARLSAAEAERIEARPTESLAAYDAYLRARSEYLRFTHARGVAAVSLLRSALKDDPEFAQATALLARTYSILSRYEPVYLDSAMVVARRAVRQDPDIAATHSALGEVFREQGFYEEAMASISLALAIEPGYAWAVAEMGEALGPYGLGRMDEAIPWIEQALRLDPKAGWLYHILGDIWRQFGEPKKAVAAFEAGRRADPDYQGNRNHILFLEAGDTAGARRYIERVTSPEDRQDPDLMGYLGYLYAAYGYPDAGRRWGRDLPAESVGGPGGNWRAMSLPVLYWLLGESEAASRAAEQSERTLQPRIEAGSRIAWLEFELAEAAMVRGDPEGAIRHLERYVEKGGREEVIMRRHALFTPLQSRPAMKSLLERVRRDLAAQRARALARASS